MIILEVINSYNILFSKIHGAVNLWRIEQAIDNKKVSVVPSYLTLSLIRTFLNENSSISTRPIGIDHKNPDLLHSLAMWVSNGRVVKLADNVLPFVLDIELLDHLDPSIFFGFPTQCLFIDNKIGPYDGALICKDYVDNGCSKKDYLLNVSLFSKQANGHQFSFVIPKKVDENFLKQFYQDDLWPDIKQFFLVFIYILYEYGQRSDFFSQNSIDYVGYNFSDEIEQNKLKSGYWRKGHWHTYFVKNNGLDQFQIKLVQPTWVSG